MCYPLIDLYHMANCPHLGLVTSVMFRRATRKFWRQMCPLLSSPIPWHQRGTQHFPESSRLLLTLAASFFLHKQPCSQTFLS